MEKVKLKSGKQFALKQVNRDELDDMTDALLDSFNSAEGVQKQPNKTMTLWFRSSIKDMSEELLMEMTLEDRVELFGILQDKYFVGEGKASDSN